MMDVVVHDGHAAQTTRTSRRRSDRDVVEEAEPQRAIALRVMAGWPDQRQRSRAGIAIKDVFDRANRRTGGQIRRRERAGRGERIRIQSHRTASSLFDGGEIVGVVNTCDLPIGHTPRRLDVASALAELGGDDLHHLEALDTLGMAGWSEMIGEMRRREDGQRHSQIVRCQFPTPNYRRPNNFQPPPPNLSAESVGSWELGIGSGWELEVGNWELVR